MFLAFARLSRASDSYPDTQACGFLILESKRCSCISGVGGTHMYRIFGPEKASTYVPLSFYGI